MLSSVLISCRTSARTVAPVPESEQVISRPIKDLYMAAGAAVPQSEVQQKLIADMADRASNAKELLLAMRAAVGVLPLDAASPPGSLTSRVRATVTGKMIAVATLNQLSEFATQYSVDPVQARAFVERMLQLAGKDPDARFLHRIRMVASHFGLQDLEQQAQLRLSSR
jgi:hypothetical protein